MGDVVARPVIPTLEAAALRTYREDTSELDEENFENLVGIDNVFAVMTVSGGHWKGNTRTEMVYMVKSWTYFRLGRDASAAIPNDML